jgi:hypothetical protein
MNIIAITSIKLGTKTASKLNILLTIENKVPNKIAYKNMLNISGSLPTIIPHKKLPMNENVNG